VFGDHLVAGNYQDAVAPVSYPYLWNIWKFDWVQYNGSVKQPLARNIGEALGVGATIRMTDNFGSPVPASQRYASSVNIPGLDRIEHTLQKLKPPRWPENLLGTIDQAKAARGQALFEQHCVGCHGPHPATRAAQLASSPLKPSADMEWAIEVIPVQHIGTDPSEATGFVERTYDLTPAGLTDAEVDKLLRPLLVRNLARDARYRLSETIDGRRAAGLDVGVLPTLLAEYPDPDASEVAAIPRSSFLAIASALDALPAPPSSGAQWTCDATCQQQHLLADVTSAEAAIDKQLDDIDLSKVTEGEGLNILGLLVKQKYFADNHVSWAQQQCLSGFGTLDLPQQIAGYKPRPLEGVWATPPFVHNGSVPNIYEMLLPPEQRTKKFFVGRRLVRRQAPGFRARARRRRRRRLLARHQPARQPQHRPRLQRLAQADRRGGEGSARAPAAAGRDRPAAYRRAALRDPRVPEGASRHAGDAGRLPARGLPPVSEAWTTDFKAVQADELAWLARRRAAAGLPPPGEDVVGLAFSGGGIRSAVFNLGVLQALEGAGLMRHVDYLSTVSGGGYIGSCYSWLRAAASPPGVAPADGSVFTKTLEGHGGSVLDWLRSHGKYLISHRGFSIWTLLASILASTFVNLLVLGPALCFGVWGLTLEWLPISWPNWLRLPGTMIPHAHDGFLLLLALAVGCFALFPVVAVVFALVAGIPRVATVTGINRFRVFMGWLLIAGIGLFALGLIRWWRCSATSRRTTSPPPPATTSASTFPG
jgi:hypothetical protein